VTLTHQEIYRRYAYAGSIARSAFALHETGDPDVFITEVDAMMVGPQGQSATFSLVQIFRVRNEHIARLRDYFPAPGAEPGTTPGAGAE
jgi:limonene-1,2-epoxide hydrolase